MLGDTTGWSYMLHDNCVIVCVRQGWMSSHGGMYQAMSSRYTHGKLL